MLNIHKLCFLVTIVFSIVGCATQAETIAKLQKETASNIEGNVLPEKIYIFNYATGNSGMIPTEDWIASTNAYRCHTERNKTTCSKLTNEK